MLFWVIQMGELLPGIDGNVRDYRYMQLSKQLVERGHRVVRWSSTFEHVSKRFRCRGSMTIQSGGQLTLRLLHATPGYRRNVSLARLLQQRNAARLFLREAEMWPTPDVIVAGVPVPEWAEASCDFGQRHGIPVVVDAQDQWPDIYETAFPCWVRPLVRAALLAEYRRSRRLFRAASAITAVSETYLRWALEKAGRARMAWDGCYPLGCPNPGPQVASKVGVAEMRQRLGIPTGATVVTFAGTFGASYDITTAVRAARLLAERGRLGVHLVLAGDGQQMADARRLAKGLRNVVLPGWLDQAEIRAINAMSAVGLCAYSSKAMQSIPYKPLEYLASGLPILSSLSGEMAEILERDRCGISYQPGDAASLAEGVEWYLDRPEQREAMGARARKLFLRRFDAAVIYPELASRLESLVGIPLSS